MAYFKHFPKVKHTNVVLTDVTRRVKFFEDIATQPYVFLPYTIEDDMRPDEVAYFYYGDSSYDWLIYLANNILDPYNEWPLSNDNFEKMIIKKYAAQANTTGYAVISWTQNQEITDNVVHYYNSSDSDVIISVDTYLLNTGNTGPLDADFNESEWIPYRYYDFELDRNEQKRTIQLVNKDYAEDIERQLKRLMTDG